MTEKTYPPLPPSRYEMTGDIKDANTFTTNDMRAYYDLGRDTQAQAALTAAQQTAPVEQGDSLDAARYRWLRDGCDIKGSAASRIASDCYGLEWDKLIDAARAQDKEPTHDN